ncbi:hypothetical protein DHD80_11470 [Gramella sp. AN32]|nr:hypothetical protein [Gramella sp. AN32]
MNKKTVLFICRYLLFFNGHMQFAYLYWCLYLYSRYAHFIILIFESSQLNKITLYETVLKRVFMAKRKMEDN